VGKSSFIEAFGLHLCEQGRKVAVLAVDPSSTVTAGSLLGDKTRMEHLSRREDAFIRPSPSGTTPGGVARKSRETILLCEAFGFEVILVETVGVGQGEVTVRSMVDYFLLLLLTGAGDELQAFKRGIMELVDGVVITKADGDNAARAARYQAEQNRVLHCLTPFTPGWSPRALTCSAHEGRGLAEVWGEMEKFLVHTRANGTFHRRRHDQNRDWLHALIADRLHEMFYRHPEVRHALASEEKRVIAGERSAARAAEELLGRFLAKLPQQM
jgi:LAO/AO transport system kinase